jgi:hypothetical protein
LADGRPPHFQQRHRFAMAASGQKGMYVNMNSGAVQAYLPPFRNALINGDMRINQRVTSTNLASLTAVATATPGSWVTDRWNVYRAGFAAGASIGQGTGMVYADMPFADAGIATYGRIGRTAANAATTAIYCDYNMESQDSYRLVGKTVTLSFYYRNGVNFSDNFLTATLYSGAATDAPLRSGTFTSFATTAFAKSSSWVRATVTGTVPTSAAQVCLRFSYTPVGTAGNADHFDVTGVQLELGSVATPFEVRHFSLELYLCQRYYVRFNTGFFNVGYAYGAGGGTYCNANLPNRMRIIQVILETPAGSTNSLNTYLMSATGFLAQYQGSAANDYQLLGVAMVQWANESGFIFLGFTASTSVTAGLGRSITIQTNYYIGFSAEI